MVPYVVCRNYMYIYNLNMYIYIYIQSAILIKKFGTICIGGTIIYSI